MHRKQLEKLRQQFEDKFGSECQLCDSECSECATENHPESEAEENLPDFKPESEEDSKVPESENSCKNMKVEKALSKNNLSNMTFTAPVIDKLVNDIKDSIS
jgi:hypothetical protein